jgi:saccharopine dehydrogenase-like NADP-dependent oxidoreductase
MANFLVLGAGLVAEPAVEYLSRNRDNEITIASYILAEAESLACKFNNIQAIQTDVSDKQQLNELVSQFDLVVSLVPAPFHMKIAQACIKNKVHMLTASYQTPEMESLSADIAQANITVMNEIGLDPGIDHLSAMQIIDNAKLSGEEIESFVSWCGGIPAPEDNNNPLLYKFSWEPRGAIMVLLNDAQYMLANNEVNISGKDLMAWSQPINISDMTLECYPNRKSIHYKETYGITDVQDIVRGTLRYKGFCAIFQSIKNLGLMQAKQNKITSKISWKNYVLQLNKVDNLDQLKTKIDIPSWHALDWLGCFSEDIYVAQKNSSVDAFCDLLLQKLSYKPTEKDMVVLQHKFVIKRADGSRYFLKSELKLLGEPNGYSAMAKTVGYPIAMAAQLIAKNKIKTKGLLLPVTPDIYEPILNLLKKESITFKETMISEGTMSKQEFLQELS